MRILSLLLLVIFPGLMATSISLYYLFPEWEALEKSFQNFEILSNNPSTSFNQLYIAQAAENRHRLNCLAEGIGLLLGVLIISVGVHGICLVDKSRNS